MIPALTRRARIVTATIVALVVVAWLSVPTSVFGIVVGGNDHPSLPAPPTLDLASGKTTLPRQQHLQRKQDVHAGRLVSEDDPFDDQIGPDLDQLEHQAKELMGDLLTDDPIELTRIPIPIDGDGLLDGFDSLQADHQPLYTFTNGGSGIPRRSVPAVGGFGRAASGGGSTRNSESTGEFTGGGSGNGDAGDRGTGPNAGEPGTSGDGPPPGIELLPTVDDGGIGLDPVLKSPEVPSPGSDGPGIEPPPIGGPGDPIAPVSVPEPSTLVLTGLGLAGLAARHRHALRAARHQAELAKGSALDIPAKPSAS